MFWRLLCWLRYKAEEIASCECSVSGLFCLGQMGMDWCLGEVEEYPYLHRSKRAIVVSLLKKGFVSDFVVG